MKKITKNEIQNVLRTGEVTDIWRICYKVIGRRPTDTEVYNFVRAYAPTKKIYNMALYFAYVRKPKQNKTTLSENYRVKNCRHIAMRMLREEIANGITPYSKRPMIWGNNLYFAPPVYWHEDYNMYFSMPIKGNERFCELLFRVADKYYNYN